MLFLLAKGSKSGSMLSSYRLVHKTESSGAATHIFRTSGLADAGRFGTYIERFFPISFHGQLTDGKAMLKVSKCWLWKVLKIKKSFKDFLVNPKQQALLKAHTVSQS